MSFEIYAFDNLSDNTNRCDKGSWIEFISLWVYTVLYVKSYGSIKLARTLWTMSKPLVTVKEGTLKGAVLKSALGLSYIAFRGIPFAAPPIGNLRFKVRFRYLFLIYFKHHRVVIVICKNCKKYVLSESKLQWFCSRLC